MKPGNEASCLISCLVAHQEGDQVNIHVTAPGAIVALGLMYMKTNDT